MLKIEAKSFRDARQDIVRIQKVIWDHLLALRVKLSRSKLHFRFRFEQRIIHALFYIRCLFCFFFRSLFYLAEVIFKSKSPKESLELMFSFKV